MSSITLGDVLQRIAAKCHVELRNFIDALPAQTPELRAEKLLHAIAKMKKRLAVLLALVKWLHDPRSNTFLNAVAGVQSEVAAESNHWNFIQDSLYFSHANLYSKRIRALDIPAAMDLLSRQTYAWLPQSIFTLNQPLQAPKHNVEDILCRLTLNIRTKLALLQLPHFSIRHVVDGRGTLGQKNLYSVDLTLSAPDADADWVVLRVALLPMAHESEVFRGKYDASSVEASLLKTLQNLSSNTNFLDLANQVCSHAAHAITLRLLYVQSLDLSRNLYHQLSEVQYAEQNTYSSVVFRFWKNSPQDKWYAYELLINLPHQVNTTALSFLSASLFSLKRDSLEDKKYTRLLIENVSLKGVIEDGVTFTHLLDRAALIITKRKMDFIKCLIDSSVAQLNEALRARLHIQSTDSKLILSIGDACCVIEVELRTGVISVSSPALFMANGKGAIAELQHEIIQIMIPVTFGNETSVAQALKSSLLSLSLVLQHLLLGHCASVIEAGCCRVSRSAWWPAVERALEFNASEIGAIYEIQTWQLKSFNSRGVKFHSCVVLSVSCQYEVAGYVVVMQTPIPAIVAPPTILHVKPLGYLSSDIASTSLDDWLEQSSVHTDTVFAHMCLYGFTNASSVLADVKACWGSRKICDNTIVLCGSFDHCAVFLLLGHRDVSLDDIRKLCSSAYSASVNLSHMLPILAADAPNLHYIQNEGIFVKCNVTSLGDVLCLLCHIAQSCTNLLEALSQNGHIPVDNTSFGSFSIGQFFSWTIADHSFDDSKLRICFGRPYVISPAKSEETGDVDILWVSCEILGHLPSVTSFAKLYSSVYKACFGELNPTEFLKLFGRFLSFVYALELILRDGTNTVIVWSCLMMESFESITLRITGQNKPLTVLLSVVTDGLEIITLSEKCKPLITLGNMLDVKSMKNIICGLFE